MFVAERRKKIIQLLNNKKRLTIKELSSQLKVSDATLRADLNKLENDGLLIRTHGGAILNDYSHQDTSFYARRRKNRKEKIQIAKIANEHIYEKQCVLLDASSTALELARNIASQSIQLTVITSGIQTALILKENPDITVIMIGGVVTTKSTSIEGNLGLDILDHFNIDVMFTSANGFSIQKGLTDFNLYEVTLKKELIKRAEKVIAIIDSSKINKNSSASFANITEVDTLITDQQINEDTLTKLSNLKIKSVF